MSNEKHETLADIVREIRQAEVTWHRSEIAQLPTQYLKEWADRIEAAWKREREVGAEAAQICGEIGEIVGREATCSKSSQVGNAAAMREALYAITLIDTRMLKRLLCELVEADIFDGGQIRNTIHAVEKARQAISAPPRNCDIYDAESCRMAYHLHGDGLMTMQAFADWLFAPAEEGGKE